MRRFVNCLTKACRLVRSGLKPNDLGFFLKLKFLVRLITIEVLCSSEKSDFVWTTHKYCKLQFVFRNFNSQKYLKEEILNKNC